MPARPKVGATIRRARQLLDMRQQDLADKLDVSRNTVDSWENDRAYPSRKQARLEQVLGISLDGVQPEPEPADEWARWEQRTLKNPALPPDLARAIVTDARAARDEYLAGLPASREDPSSPSAPEGRTAGRHRAAS